MIRCKAHAADLRLGYAGRVLKCMSLAAGLSAALFLADPEIRFPAPTAGFRPLVIRLEHIPPTEQPVSLQLHPPPRPAKRVSPPSALRELPPLRIVTEFPTEEEDEVVDLWMVERRPQVRTRLLPDYPESALRAGIEGRVQVRVLVGRDGSVERVDSISGPRVFHAAVAAVADRWTFTPALQNDRPVRVWVRLPFTFSLDDETAD